MPWFPYCGCYYYDISSYHKLYLPIVGVKAHSTIVSTASHTTLSQTFANSYGKEIKECTYDFPLYDGVSVTSFTCRIGERKIKGVVHEKQEAKAIFDAAVARGETAGLLSQSQTESDLFTTTIGNIPAGESVHVEITYVGDLKHDAEADGIRFTIPTAIAPRYEGTSNASWMQGRGSSASSQALATSEGMSITVDANMADGSSIKSIQSPSHPIEVSMGVSSANLEADPVLTKASATLALGTTELDTDFVLIIKAKDADQPKAILEKHPHIANQRALMATLVPKFALAPIRPEIVFVVDRSGSMEDNMSMVIDAMKIFLKSLPTGVMFNICSFGSRFTFLWPKSKEYTKDTLATAVSHVSGLGANYGGTETLSAIVATVENRFKDIPLEIVLITDGDIRMQEQAFQYVNEEVAKSKDQIRLFPLGIGHGVSHSLIEGLARAGKGFAQAVQQGERLEARLVRMLKGALSPHITDYSLELQYGEEDEFELVEKFTDCLKVDVSADTKREAAGGKGDAKSPAPSATEKTTTKSKISLFDSSTKLDTLPATDKPAEDWLPTIKTPKIIQAPATLPSLFPFNRTNAYVLLSPETIQRNPVAVILRGTSPQGPLELRIPVVAMDEPGTTFHALAARKAAQDLEEGRGWLHKATDEKSGRLIKEVFPSRFEKVVEREAVRLGTTFQVANRWCSFVAVEANSTGELVKGDFVVNPGNATIAPPAYSARKSSGSGPLVSNTMHFHSPGYSGGVGRGGSQGFESSQLRELAATSGGIARFCDTRGSDADMLTDTQFMSSRSSMQMPMQMQQTSLGSQQSSSRSGWGHTLFGSSTPQVQQFAQMSQQPVAPSGAPMQKPLQKMSPVSASSRPGGSSPPAPASAFVSASASYGSGAGGPPALNTGGGDGSQGGSAEANKGVGFRFRKRASGKVMDRKNVAPLMSPRMHDAARDRSTRGGDTMDLCEPDKPAGLVKKTDADKLRALIDLQDFEGCWPCNEQVAGLLGVSYARVLEARPTEENQGGTQSQSPVVWATVLVLAFLESKMKGEEEIWEMVADKARAWLDGEYAGWRDLLLVQAHQVLNGSA